LSREISEILRSHAAPPDDGHDHQETVHACHEQALEEIKEVVAMEKGKGIGGSETL